MIRRANLNDISNIINLEHKIFNQSLGKIILENIYNNYPFSNILVYEIDKQIIGYLSYRLNDKNSELLNFLIDTNFQRKGYGSKLFDYYIDELKRNKVESIILEVRSKNEKALSFYNKYKPTFIKTIKNYYINDDAIVLLIRI